MILRPLVVTLLFGLLFACMLFPAEVEAEATGPPPLADVTTPAKSPPQVGISAQSSGFIPLAFVATGRENEFHLQGSSATLRFDRTGSTYPLADGEFAPRREFVGSSAHRSLIGQKALPGTTNWLVGNDPSGWRVDQPNYAGLQYRELYPGVDLSIDAGSRPGFLRQQFILAPGSNLSTVRWRYSDLTAQIGEDNQTLATAQETTSEIVLESELRGWQDVDGQEVAVDVRYASDASGTFFFGLEGYKPAYPLAIESYIPVADQTIDTQTAQDTATDEWDPLTFSTLFGGNRYDVATSIAVDAAGNVYVAGASTSDNFPQVGAFPFSRSCNERYTVGVIFKLNPDATQVLYATYFGGGCNDTIFDIEVDAQERIFVTGYTSSPNFPTAGAPLTPSAGGAEPCVTETGPTKGFLCRAESFVAWFDKDGKTLLFSSFFGGDESDIATSLAVDDSTLFFGGATGSESLTGAGDRHSIGAGGGVDAFVARVSLETQQLLSVTRIGGDKSDGVEALVLGPNGELFLSGVTSSANLPTRNPVQSTLQGDKDAFVMQLDPSGANLIYATYWGGAKQDITFAVDADADGNAYIAGYTDSTDLPTTPGVIGPVSQPFDDANRWDAFVASFTLTGTLRYATFLGGSGSDVAQDLVVDSAGMAYVVGHTNSLDFPTVDPIQSTLGGVRDSFVSRISRDGTELIFSTYLGGSDDDSLSALATDNKSSIYLTGVTNGSFPTTPGVVQPTPPACDPDTACHNIHVTRLNFLPWTYLIYSALDNDLSGMEWSKMNSLEQFAADNPYVQIVVLLDIDFREDPIFTDSAYYVVSQEDISFLPASYETDVNFFPHAELDTADPQTLVDFVTWAKKRYPSRHVALVMDSHGTGVTGAMYDDYTGSSAPKRGMTIQEIGQALDTVTNGGQDKIDLLYMVACLMGMVEPAYEWRTSVDYYLSSEQIYISDFGPNLALSANIITDTIRPRLLAERTADAYAEMHIAGIPVGAPPYDPTPYSISVADLSQIEPLHQAVHVFADAIADHLRDSPESWLTFSQIISDVQHFDSSGNLKIEDNDEYIDLYHFALLINTRISDTNLKAVAQSVMDRVQDYIIYNRADGGENGGNYWDHSNAYGAAIFLPKTPRSFYDRFNLSFLQPPPASIARNVSEPESGWKGFHNNYVALSNPDAVDNPTPPSLLSPQIIGSVPIPNRRIYLPTVQR